MPPEARRPSGPEQQHPQSTPIVPEFTSRHTNLFAYPERGPWGDPTYPGNFSGKFVLDLIDLYKARSVADPFAGGGTTEAVCKELGIPHWAGDLRDGFNVLEDAVPPCSDGTSPDLVMFHLPYFDLIHYSGQVWGEAPHPADLSAAPTLDDFIRMANEAQYNAYSHVRQGGHVAILIGSIRREGVLYPLHRMINLYGKLDVDGIKVQFNTTGARTPHPARHVALLVTEWVMVMEKPHAWIVPVRIANAPKDYDMRRSDRQTWRSIVLSALEACGGAAPLEKVYEAVAPHARVREAEAQGTDWQAVVRRELQEGPFQSGQRGEWKLASPPAETPVQGAEAAPEARPVETTPKENLPLLQKATPIFRQYAEIKQQFPGTIVLFRLGDFYETFNDDAEILARELDIVLTSRNIAKDKRIPMSGIPYHAAENYIARLIAKGYHVAVCDQVGDEPVNGLMPREVVRVVAPGEPAGEPPLPDEQRQEPVTAARDETSSRQRPTWDELRDRLSGVPDEDLEEGEWGAHEV